MSIKEGDGIIMVKPRTGFIARTLKKVFGYQRNKKTRRRVVSVDIDKEIPSRLRKKPMTYDECYPVKLD